MTPRHRSPASLSCREVGRILQAHLDSELDDVRAILVAEHLDACLRCGLDANSYRWLKIQLASMALDDDAQLDRLRVFADELLDEPA